MPPKFTKSLAERLNGMCPLEVKEAEDSEQVKSNVIYIAPGGFHMTVRRNGIKGIEINVTTEPQ